MLDSVKRPTLRASQGASPNARSLEERLRVHHEKEKKLWFAIIGTCVVVIGVWTLTFQLPKTQRDPEGGSVSELRSILQDVVQNTKQGWKEIQAQKPVAGISLVSDQKLSELARELVAGATTSSTTLFELQNGTSTKARLP